MHRNTAAADLWSWAVDVCRANMSSVLKVSWQTNHCPIYWSSCLHGLQT